YTHCSCRRQTEEDLFENLLPSNLQGTFLQGQQKTVVASLTDDVPIQLVVSAVDLKIATLTEKTPCQLSDFELSGCYDCVTGARLTYNCTTKFGNAQAAVRCPSNSFLIPCSESGTVGEETLVFKSTYVQESCVMQCPGGRFTFDLSARLHYVETRTSPNKENQSIGTKLNTTISLLDFSDMFTVIKYLLALIVIVIVVFAISYLAPLMTLLRLFRTTKTLKVV
uniref:Phlebovirus_G2 domain-containing protein n=1 Tax=Steinernema glaseri TaxID=37863 RepID=A0A1I8AGP8_9BILA